MFLVTTLMECPGLVVGFSMGVFVGFVVFDYLNVNKNGEDIEENFQEDIDKKNSVIVHDDSEKITLTLVIRNDLKMGKGKVAAQCSHASLLAYKQLMKVNRQVLWDWFCRDSAPMTICKVENEDKLYELAEKAEECGLLTGFIRDAGRTQVAAGSVTTLAIGPGDQSLIKFVTSDLKMY